MSDELRRLLAYEIEKRVAPLEVGPADADGALLAVVSLKGSAGLAGEAGLAASLTRLEVRLRSGDATAVAATVALLRRAAQRIKEGSAAVPDNWPVPPFDLEPGEIDPDVRGPYHSEVKDRLAALDLCLSGDDDVIEKVRVAFRHVHTLKGAASAVGDEPMSWFCHGLEERLRDVTEDARAKLALLEVSKVRGVLGAMAEAPAATLRRLRDEVESPPSSGALKDASSDDEGNDATVRVATENINELLSRIDGLGTMREELDRQARRAREAARRVRAIRAEGAHATAGTADRREAVDRALATLGDDLDAMGGELRHAGDAFGTDLLHVKRLAGVLRTTSMGSIFDRVAAVVEAEGRRLGREVRTRATGDEELIDRRLTERLVEPCMHIARNAVAHGIEAPEVRRAAAKDPIGTITLTAKRAGDKLSVTIADDGAGVDLSRVRAHAVARGVLTEERAAAEPDAQILALLLRPGFSLRQAPDLLAGRGIGLDIALHGIRKLGGSLKLMSRPGQGFSVRLELPTDPAVSGLRVERMTEDDLPAAIEIVELTGTRPADEQRQVAATRLREELGRPWSRVRVVRSPAGELLAMLVAWQVADEVHVLDVVTRASWRRRGLGRALMNELVAFAKGLPVRHILLEVRRSNAPAIKLYRSLGFFATNVRRRYYDDGEDAVEMRLVFDETSREVRLLADEIPIENP